MFRPAIKLAWFPPSSTVQYVYYHALQTGKSTTTTVSPLNLFTADNVNNTFCILLKHLPRTYTYAGATLLLTMALDKHKIYIYLSAKYELCTRSCYSIQTKITLQTWQMGLKQCMGYGTERVNLLQESNKAHRNFHFN